jgi:hypothetical protein
MSLIFPPTGRGAVELTGIGLGHPGLSLSVGAAAFVPFEGDVDADSILAQVDKRMYANKRRRKGLAPSCPEVIPSRVDLLSARTTTLSVH